MKAPIYQVDAFSAQTFGGNPAAVMPLDRWLDDTLLQHIASENNLSETAYVVKSTDGMADMADFELRWFTPVNEVAMCGHATLATAHVLFSHLSFAGKQIRFATKSGVLTVQKNEDVIHCYEMNCYEMNFPAVSSQPVAINDVPEALLTGLNIDKSCINGIYNGLNEDTDYLIELASVNDVAQIAPNFVHWQNLNRRGVIVTAATTSNDADEVTKMQNLIKQKDLPDIVSRCFYPDEGVPEDPVTGSAHCQLMPYWSDKLGKHKLTALQLSKRQGLLHCKLIKGANGNEDRVKLTGNVADYMVGEVSLASAKTK